MPKERRGEEEARAATVTAPFTGEKGERKKKEKESPYSSKMLTLPSESSFFLSLFGCNETENTNNFLNHKVPNYSKSGILIHSTSAAMERGKNSL